MGEKILLYFNNEDLQQLVKLSGTTDKKQVTKWIKEKSLTEIQQSESQQSSKKSLDELKKLDLTIKCWKGLLEIRDSVPFKIDPMAILQGTQTLEAPQLTMLNNGSTQIEKKYLVWHGNQLICQGCNHQHFSTGARPCFKTECNCSIHEVDL